MPQLIILLVFGAICAFVASARGRTPVGWFVLGFLFPILAVILVLVLPDLRIQQEKERRLQTENRRLRERVRKDRQVADQRYSEHQSRLAVHDEALGVDTAQRVLPRERAVASLPPALPADPPSGIRAADWYYAVGQEHEGPISYESLRGYLESGIVSPETLVWTEDMADWVRLDQHQELWENLRG